VKVFTPYSLSYIVANEGVIVVQVDISYGFEHSSDKVCFHASDSQHFLPPFPKGRLNFEFIVQKVERCFRNVNFPV